MEIIAGERMSFTLQLILLFPWKRLLLNHRSKTSKGELIISES